MKRALLFLFFFAVAAPAAFGQIYKGTHTKVSFFSYTPLENISAVDTVGVMLLNAKTNDVFAKVTMKGFTFPNALMQDHFNEEYMESDKYPEGQFKGKINEKIDYSKDGTYKITMTGSLTIHGVTKPRTVDGTLTIKNGIVILDSKFSVALVDHNIKVPEAVGAKIAESIDVTIHTEMINVSPKK